MKATPTNLPSQNVTASICLSIAGATSGPFSEIQILDMVRQGQVRGETPAWKEGLTDWVRLDHLISLILSNIYVDRSGKIAGPFSEAEVRSMLDAGMAGPTDLVSHDRAVEWLPLHQVLKGVAAPLPVTGQSVVAVPILPAAKPVLPVAKSCPHCNQPLPVPTTGATPTPECPHCKQGLNPLASAISTPPSTRTSQPVTGNLLDSLTVRGVLAIGLTLFVLSALFAPWELEYTKTTFEYNDPLMSVEPTSNPKTITVNQAVALTKKQVRTRFAPIFYPPKPNAYSDDFQLSEANDYMGSSIRLQTGAVVSTWIFISTIIASYLLLRANLTSSKLSAKAARLQKFVIWIVIALICVVFLFNTQRILVALLEWFYRR